MIGMRVGQIVTAKKMNMVRLEILSIDDYDMVTVRGVGTGDISIFDINELEELEHEE